MPPPGGVKGLGVPLPDGIFSGFSLLVPGSGVVGAVSRLVPPPVVPPPVGDGSPLLEPAGGVGFVVSLSLGVDGIPPGLASFGALLPGT